MLIHATNAPGLSAFNPCERRMAPLSRKLVGLVLEHDHFGNHLDNSGKTKDVELEKKNFNKAAEVLASIWGEGEIDGHKVSAHPVAPSSGWGEVEKLDEKWVATHVRQSKYMLQIIKCTDDTCCTPFKSNWLYMFPMRFLPCPAISEFTPRGREPILPSNIGPKHQFLPLLQRLLLCDEMLKVPEICSEAPFDLYCPSMQGSLLECICPTCGVQWPNKTAILRHKKSHVKTKVMAAIVPEDEPPADDINKSSTVNVVHVGQDEPMPVISIESFMTQPWEEV